MALVFLFAALLFIPYVWRLSDEEFHGDETHWLTSSQVAYSLVTSGAWDDPQWHTQFYFYTQPQIGKLLIGAVLSLDGMRGMRDIVEYDWIRSPEENRLSGAVPSASDLVVGRRVGAVAGWIGSLLLWRLGVLLGSIHSGILGATLLAFHPLWLANSRRVGMDTLAITLGLVASAVLIQMLVREKLSFRGMLLFGLLAGMTLSTKYTGAFGLIASLALLGPAVRVWPVREWPGVALAARKWFLALATALVTVYATNPAWYFAPIEGVRTSLGFFQDQASAMRETYPVFRSTLLTAAEIVDRVVVPTGFPMILDTTMMRTEDDRSRTLSPGSYGTPVVAVGLLTGIGILFLRRRGTGSVRRVAIVAGVWSGTAFIALTISLPIWWERWHLGIVPALCLFAGAGLCACGARVVASAAVAQVVSTILTGPSYLNHGFDSMLASPVSEGLHLLAIGMIVVSTFRLTDRFAEARARWRARLPILAEMRYHTSEVRE